MRYALIAILSLCAGCSQYRTLAKEEGAEAADAALSAAVWGQCQAATMGAFARRYPTEAERIAELARCDKEAAR